MSDQKEMERTLRRFEHRLSPRVRDAAMAAVECSGARRRTFWYWRVPLPAAAAGVVLAAAVAFTMGQHAGRDTRPTKIEPVGQAMIATSAPAAAWAVATTDILADRTRPALDVQRPDW